MKAKYNSLKYQIILHDPILNINILLGIGNGKS